MKRGDQHEPQTRTTPPTVRAQRRHGYMSSSETHSRIGRWHTTPAEHHVHINSRSAHTLLLTLAVSEPARPHVPPNLALILAWTYGAVAHALGSLVKLVPRLLLHSQTVPLTTRQVPECTNHGNDKRSHALPQYTYCITTNTPQSAAVRRYYRARRHT